MRLRFPLLLKKRGRRRTGSPRWAQFGALLYQMMFVVAGAVGVWWLLQDVLLPEARLAREAENFATTTCEVVGARVASRPGLAEGEFCAELRVRFEAADGQTRSVWTRHGVARDTPSRAEAAADLKRYEVGEQRTCWYDPDDPARVFLSVRRRWWPWLVLSIPISLIVAGSIGILRTLLRTQSSPERRATLQRRVADAALADESPNALPAAFALPVADRVGDSPGVRLAHRLPMDGSDGWRVLGMATLCVLWNALAGVFAYQLTAGLSVGGRLGLAALAIAPLAATGAWLTYSLLRDARSAGGAGVTRVEVSRHPLYPGDRCEGILIQSGPFKARALTVSLICIEEATFLQGTDARTTTAEAHREVLHRQRRGGSTAGSPHASAFAFAVPADAPPSFVAPHNRVSWAIEVAVGPPRRPDSVRRYRLCVYPTSVRSHGADGASPTPPTEALAV